MQYPKVQFLIEYFLMLQPEYYYSWNQHHIRNYICGYNLTNIPAFLELKDYMTSQKLLYFDEADWLEDAIHETLLDYE